MVLFNWDVQTPDESRQGLGIMKQSMVTASKDLAVKRDEKLTEFLTRQAHLYETAQLAGTKHPPISYEDFVIKIAKHLKAGLAEDFVVMLNGVEVADDPPKIIVVQNDEKLRTEIGFVCNKNRAIAWHEFGLSIVLGVSGLLNRKITDLVSSSHLSETDQMLCKSMREVLWISVIMTRTYRNNPNPTVRRSLILEHLKGMQEFGITVQ